MSLLQASSPSPAWTYCSSSQSPHRVSRISCFFAFACPPVLPGATKKHDFRGSLRGDWKHSTLHVLQVEWPMNIRIFGYSNKLWSEWIFASSNIWELIFVPYSSSATTLRSAWMWDSVTEVKQYQIPTKYWLGSIFLNFSSALQKYNCRQEI